MDISTAAYVVLPPTTSSIGHQKPRNMEIITSRSSQPIISLDGASGDSACFAALLTSTLSSAARQCVADRDDATATPISDKISPSASLPSSLATPPPSPPQQSQTLATRGELDTKIAQVVDDVKSHLLNAVRSEVETLKQQIFKLERKVSDLLYENKILRQYVPDDVLSQLPPPQSPAPDDRRCSPPPLPSLQCVF